MDSENKDYYGSLGLNDMASIEDIKKAYKKLRLMHHPDKNGGKSSEKFIEIQEAYTILSDEEKRKIYDDYGYAGLKEYEHTQMSGNQVRLQPLVVEVKCTIKELYNGTRKTVTIKISIIGGKMSQPQTLKKVSEVEELMEVEIPQFSCYGHKIIEREKGHRHATDDLHGDLIFVVTPSDLESEDDYTLENADIHYTLKLTLSEALIGFRRKFEFLDGKNVVITSPNITKPGTIKIIKNMGFKMNIQTPFGIVNKIGHLFIHFDLTFPETLSHKQIKYVAAIFGLPKPDTINDDETLNFKIDEMATIEDLKKDDSNSNQGQIFMSQGGGMSPGDCRPM